MLGSAQKMTFSGCHSADFPHISLYLQEPTASAGLPRPIKVVGMGSAGVDYLAQVASYPMPDEKLRTERLEVQGGGNCGNALTAAARLGLTPTILTKIGDDALGDTIIAEFHRDGIETSGILRAAGAPSPFTYIIVDRQGGTRTCIHTPGEALTPDEMTEDLVQSVLQDASLVYFDGRLTEAALLLARAARNAGIPVLVEAERLRPGLEVLLREADYVVTSAHFPRDWTGVDAVGSAMALMLHRLPRVQWVITTQGARGSILFERANSLDHDTTSDGSTFSEADQLIEELFHEASSSTGKFSGNSAGAIVCRSESGTDIALGGVTSMERPRRLHPGASLSNSNSGADSFDAGEMREAAARYAASLNADPGNFEAYASRDAATNYEPAPHVKVTVATAAVLPAGAVVDTTGAGDAFIGSVIFCIATGLPVTRALTLGAVVAACKCTMLGARPGLPRRTQLAASLLLSDQK